MSGPRTLPSKPCGRCRQPMAWARTTAGENGPGGKAMPLNPVPDPAGNVAVSEVSRGTYLARVLKADEGPIHGVETVYMPHFATCAPQPETPVPDNVIPFKKRAKR